jgi:hypothetical protein
VELLERERLPVIEHEAPAEVLNEVHFFSVTYLGLSFVKTCSPRAIELMAERAVKPSAV